MFVGYGNTTDTLDKTAMINNIITMVRAAQKNKIIIDYDSIIENVKAMGPNNPEVEEVEILLNTLRSTNPY